LVAGFSKRQDVMARRGSSQGAGLGTTEMLPDTTDWYGRSRPKADASNDYLLDREKAQRGASYTGLPSVVLEDQAITESMGPIYNRSQEHLGTSDIMIIRTRLRLMRAAKLVTKRALNTRLVTTGATVGSGSVIIRPNTASRAKSTIHPGIRCSSVEITLQYGRKESALVCEQTDSQNAKR